MIFRSVHISIATALFISLTSLLIYSSIFRFQRTTLGIARAMGFSEIQVVANIQSFLTPDYISFLHWINTVITAVSFTLIGINISWVVAILFLLVMYIGIGVTDVFMPYPSYKYCVKLIQNHLNDDRGKSKSIELLAIKYQVLNLLGDLQNLNNRDFEIYTRRTKAE